MFASLDLAATVLPNRRALTDGPGVSIYCDRQRPDNWAEHQHDVSEVLIALESARCRFTWREADGAETSRMIGSGDLLFLAPGVRHAKSWLNEAGVIILYLGKCWLRQFCSPELNGVRFESFRDLNFRDPLIGGLTHELYKNCIPSCAHHHGHAIALGQCLAARVVHNLFMDQAPHPTIRRLSNDTMQRVMDHIQANLSERIPMKALAQEARFSVSHFSKLFKATTGMTCERYILRCRLMRAKVLIETGAYTVGQVAHMLGFSDHSHLTFQFTRQFGAPPKAYLPQVRIV